MKSSISKMRKRKRQCKVRRNVIIRRFVLDQQRNLSMFHLFVLDELYNSKLIISLMLIILIITMITLGPSLRRKSFERPDPVLPRALKREPSSNGRTVYKEIKLPSEELSEYHKRYLFTTATLTTDKSLSRIRPQEPMKQSRYDDDHHNTDSIAQLFEGKNQSQVPNSNTKRSENQPSGSLVQSHSQQKDSLASESITQREGEAEEVPEIGQDAEPQFKEGENYDDYVLGDQVQQEIQEKPEKNSKKYKHDHSTQTLTGYHPSSQSELRLQRQHFLNERRRLQQINEDREIATLMAQYKNNKNKILSQSSRKHQTARILAALHSKEPKQYNKIEKSLSLPALKAKKEIVVPDDYYEERMAQPWKNTKNLLAKNVEQRGSQEQRLKLKNTLSYGKLGFGRKKTRTICEQDILQEEMGALEEIKEKLRSKGIPFDAGKLKKGLLNQKNEPYDHNRLECPDKRLPSNPIYKKFPL